MRSWAYERRRCSEVKGRRYLLASDGGEAAAVGEWGAAHLRAVPMPFVLVREVECRTSGLGMQTVGCLQTQVV